MKLKKVNLYELTLYELTNMIKNQINKKFNVKSNQSLITKVIIEIVETKYKLILEFDNDLETRFFKNYLIHNVFGKNYLELSPKRNQRILTIDNAQNQIIIKNKLAFIIFLNHFRIQIQDESLLNITMHDDSIIYVKTTSNVICPVIIISPILLDGDSHSIHIQKKIKINLLKNYYKSVFGDSLSIENINLMNNINSESFKAMLNDNIKHEKLYIVFHPFYDTKETSNAGDTYKQMFTKVGDNEFGIQVMKKHYGAENIPEISEDERLLLKKNIDKMFDVPKYSKNKKYKIVSLDISNVSNNTYASNNK